MTRVVKCVITGCSLLGAEVNLCLSGDLFDAGDCWVFNGNPQWVDVRDMLYKKTITLDPTHDYFERRHVFVIPKANAILNKDALEYIR